MDQLNLESDKGTIVLGPNTLVFAIDDTGNESFKDPNHQVFGIGGCGFMVRDYARLVDEPWSQMCNRFFKSYSRPLHAASIQFTKEQMEALADLFSNFEFFRIAVTTNVNLENKTDKSIIDLIATALLARIAKVGEWAEFNRLMIIFEASDRIEARVLKSISNKKVVRGDKEIELELATIPKSACMSGMEIADFIAHTSGAQARTMELGAEQERKDFQLIFKSINDNLTSFLHITKAAYTNA